MSWDYLDDFAYDVEHYDGAINYTRMRDKPGQHIMYWYGKCVLDLDTEHMVHILRSLIRDYRNRFDLGDDDVFLWARFVAEYRVAPALIFELEQRKQLNNFPGLDSYVRELNEGMIPFWLLDENKAKNFRYGPDKHNIMQYLEESTKHLSHQTPKAMKICMPCKGTGVYVDISFTENTCPMCGGKGEVTGD